MPWAVFFSLCMSLWCLIIVFDLFQNSPNDHLPPARYLHPINWLLINFSSFAFLFFFLLFLFHFSSVDTYAVDLEAFSEQFRSFVSRPFPLWIVAEFVPSLIPTWTFPIEDLLGPSPKKFIVTCFFPLSSKAPLYPSTETWPLLNPRYFEFLWNRWDVCLPPHSPFLDTLMSSWSLLSWSNIMTQEYSVQFDFYPRFPLSVNSCSLARFPHFKDLTCRVLDVPTTIFPFLPLSTVITHWPVAVLATIGVVATCSRSLRNVRQL